MVQERPRERDVTRPVARDEPQRRPHGLVFGLLKVAHVEIQVELVVERAQRGALGQSWIDAPRAAAPRATRGLARGPGVARRIKAVPRDVGLGVPAQALGLAVELAERRHLRREREREAPLDEPLLLRLVRA